MKKFILFILLTGCFKPEDPVCGGDCYEYCSRGLLPQTNKYTTNFDETTPKGIYVDRGGWSISLSKIDEIVDNAEECLINQFGNPPKIPKELRGWGILERACPFETFSVPLKRECLYIKIAEDWDYTCRDTEELAMPKQEILPILAPEETCLEKGIIPTKECPCRWRVVLQGRSTIVMTPSMYMLKDTLIRIVTGCNNPWQYPLSTCANPTVPPLSGFGPRN